MMFLDTSKLRPELRRDQSSNEVQNLSKAEAGVHRQGMGGEEIFQTTNGFQCSKYETITSIFLKSESENSLVI